MNFAECGNGVLMCACVSWLGHECRVAVHMQIEAYLSMSAAASCGVRLLGRHKLCFDIEIFPAYFMVSLKSRTLIHAPSARWGLGVLRRSVDILPLTKLAKKAVQQQLYLMQALISTQV